MTRSRRRRARAGPGSGHIVEDAFDLFLDALANTLGVIMFIALMVVIFASPSPTQAPATPQADPSEAEQVHRLLDRLAQLERELAQLPPAGDPALIQKLAELDAELTELRERIADATRRAATVADEIRLARQQTREQTERSRELEAQRIEFERRTATVAASSSFVRVSRFRDDARAPVLLLVSAGGVERADPTPGETRILPGARPRRPVETIEQARAAVDSLLRDASPARNRIEVAVWSDSFASYKRLERALVDRGFDLNPMPLAAGTALEAGRSGIQ